MSTYYVPPHVPVTREGDDAVRCSKYGGTPWLERGDSWPICELCAQPMQFVVQLARADVPADLHWAFAGDLLQVFFCASRGKLGDPWWSCQATGGWEPFAPTTVIRHVHLRSGPAPVRDAISIEPLDVRRRVNAEVMEFYARRLGNHALADSWRARVQTERVTPDAYRVPTSRSDDSLLYPPVRVTAWHLLEDSSDAAPGYGDQLGGDPMWLHDEEHLSCRSCAIPMRHLLQIPSESLIPLNFGGGGIAWVFGCAGCHAATLMWQR